MILPGSLNMQAGPGAHTNSKLAVRWISEGSGSIPDWLEYTFVMRLGLWDDGPVRATGAWSRKRGETIQIILQEPPKYRTASTKRLQRRILFRKTALSPKSQRIMVQCSVPTRVHRHPPDV